MAKTKKRTMEQFGVLFVEGQHVTQEGNEYVYHVRETDWTSVSENATLRNPAFYRKVTLADEQEVTLADGTKHKVINEKEVNRSFFAVYKVAPIGVSAKLQKTLVHRAKTILRKGLVLAFPNGKRVTYKRVMRSASQYRTGKFLMTIDKYVKPVRTAVTYGWVDRFINKMVNVAKIEPYLSLASTSSLSAGTGWTSVDIKDAVSWVDITGAMAVNHSQEVVNYAEFLINDTDKVEGEDYRIEGDRILVPMELTDGQALVSPYGAAKIAFRIDQISERQFKMIESASAFGMTFAEQLAHPALERIWNKISRGFQFRFGIKKGFLIIVDHKHTAHNGQQADFVFPKGAIKGQVRPNETVESFEWETENVELNIANVAPTEEKTWGRLNYQFIQSLNIAYEDLRELAIRGMKKVVEGLESPEKAMMFLGMLASGEEDEVEQSFSTQLHDMLKANPRAFYLRWVQVQLKKLMEVAISDMRMGRIPLEDSRFVFIVTDPSALDVNGQPLLKKGECYYNGQTGERAIFRSPLIHESEAVVINLVSRPELDEAFGHMKNVLVLNAFDDTLPRMGGASL